MPFVWWINDVNVPPVGLCWGSTVTFGRKRGAGWEAEADGWWTEMAGELPPRWQLWSRKQSSSVPALRFDQCMRSQHAAESDQDETGFLSNEQIWKCNLSIKRTTGGSNETLEANNQIILLMHSVLALRFEVISAAATQEPLFSWLFHLLFVAGVMIKVRSDFKTTIFPPAYVESVFILAIFLKKFFFSQTCASLGIIYTFFPPTGAYFNLFRKMWQTYLRPKQDPTTLDLFYFTCKCVLGENVPMKRWKSITTITTRWAGSLRFHRPPPGL